MTRQWKITSNPAYLRIVRTELEAFAQSGGMPLEKVHQVGLVVNEAMANIIRHGYDGATDKPILVTAETDGNRLEIEIRDWAKPFDPALIKRKLEGELSPGGLGLVCIRKLMDDVRFERLPDGMRLRMIKNVA
jgi:anti-sigma regulatory factor (Ser/Thr protein kinase)